MTKSREKVRVSRPPAHLSALINRPGGMLRDIAISRGQAGLEKLRAPAKQMLLSQVAELEELAAVGIAAQSNLFGKIDAIISLAETFDMIALSETGRRLSDLIKMLATHDAAHPKAIAVHLRAMRLFCLPQSDIATAGIMDELDRVRKHVHTRFPAEC
jgi:hypothetical protein